MLGSALNAIGQCQAARPRAQGSLRAACGTRQEEKGPRDVRVHVLFCPRRQTMPPRVSCCRTKAARSAGPSCPPLSTLEYPFVWTKGVLKGYSSTRVSLWDSLMVGRLAMGFANVWAGIRVLMLVLVQAVHGRHRGRHARRLRAELGLAPEQTHC